MSANRFSRAHRLVDAVLVLALALGAVICSASATGAVPISTPQEQVILDPDAQPAFTWTVPDRYQASWSAYRKTTSSYDPTVINPRTWSLNIDGCKSTSLYAITGYQFALKQVGTTWQRTYDTTACRLNLHSLLPAQGDYQVSLTLHTQGSFSGISYPTVQIVTIRDILIVSMGDSLASGEGNPDVPGIYNYSIDRYLNVTTTTVRTAQWKDRRCHRSANSGPARAAEALEASSPHTSVTFVSVACSGAEIANLIDVPYAGSEKVGNTTVFPQSQDIAALLGPQSPRGGRPIDAMLISAGINDLHFSDIIERCASNAVLPWHDSATCVTNGGIADELDGLRSKYSILAFVLAWSLPNIRNVYINDYPANVFDGGGCDALGLPGLGIDSHESDVMKTWGRRMNTAIASAAQAFSSVPMQWNLVAGMEPLFLGHAYCATRSWFVTLEQSLAQQGNNKGTAHPNAAGLVAFASLIRQTIALG